MPRWLPLALGLGLSAGALGVWQALIFHEEEQIPLLSGVILAGGILGALLVAIAIALAQKAMLRSRELQEGKAELETLFEASLEALVVTDRNGRIVSANQRVQSVFGYTPEEIVGAQIERLVPIPLQCLHGRHRESYYAAPSARPMGRGSELYARHKDGSEFAVDVSLSPLQSKGELRVLAAVRDITKRKQAEEALRQSEERFRGIFEQGPIGVALMGRDYRLIKVNLALSRMLGYSEAELTTMTPLDFTYPDDLEPTINLMERLFEAETPMRKMEKRYVRKTGEVIWGSMTASVVHDPKGKPLYAIGMIEDITERRAAEQKVAEQAALLDLAHDAIFVRSLEGRRITFWSRGAADTYGWTASEVLGRVADDLLQTRFPIPREEVEATVRMQGAWEGELEHTTRDGRKLQVTSRWSLQRDERGTPEATLEINRDITARKQMEEDLEAARKQAIHSARLSALGMMAGGIAHEINNPLSIIHAMASDLQEMVAEEGSAPPHVVARKSTVIRQTAERIAKIVKSLRQISREGSSDLFHPTPVAKILAETLEICRAKFKANDVELLLPQAIPELSVPCREVQIAQALLNLLQNAFDAALEQEGERWVRVEVNPGDDLVAISVIDSGPGIPSELRSRIGEPFFTTKPVGKGTGLGLSLSKTIAEDHGGSLEYGEDHGHTRFSLVLPLARKAEAA
jgi:PAS domain S-box-containing protein